MKDLTLHTLGHSEYLNALRVKYDSLKTKVNEDSHLTAEEKQLEIKKLNQMFKQEKKELHQRLFLNL